MRKLCCHTCLLLAFVFSQSCGKKDVYARQVKTVDSLSGAINALVKELEKTDTLLLQRSVARFNDYRKFVTQHIKDTILKAEADNLQHFYAGGYCLENFITARKTLLARAALIRSQLTKLALDIDNRSAGPETLARFIEHEAGEAGRFMDAGYDQQRKFHAGSEEFKNSIHGVESLIRSRNRGELPTIIKDTVNL
jgi:hypothetical protein